VPRSFSIIPSASPRRRSLPPDTGGGGAGVDVRQTDFSETHVATPATARGDRELFVTFSPGTVMLAVITIVEECDNELFVTFSPGNPRSYPGNPNMIMFITPSLLPSGSSEGPGPWGSRPSGGRRRPATGRRDGGRRGNSNAPL
jgi:hypothetical protein